jgi:RNA polymerase primary sigma factor
MANLKRKTGTATHRSPRAVESRSKIADKPSDEEPVKSVKSAKAVSEPSIDDQLSTYFRHLGEHDLLSADDERRLSVAIEIAEMSSWQHLFSIPELVLPVLEFLTPHLDGDQVPDFSKLQKQCASMLGVKSDAKAVKKLEALASEAAVQMRGCDLDREHIDAVMREVERLQPTLRTKSAAKAKLTMLDMARAANREASRLRNDFVRANLRLVVTMARRYDRGQMPLSDLIQEGNLGLMHSVGRFDHKRGLRFSTYACWWIRHAIGRAMADKARAVRIPVHMLEAQQQLEKVRRELTRSLGRPPSPAELAKAARVPIAKLDQMHQYVMGHAVSLDKPVHGDDERTFGDTMADPNTEDASLAETMTHEALSGQIRGMLRHLSPIEADVLTKRFGIGDDEERTFREIGDEYALSRERIRQIQNGALDKLKRALEREHRGHVSL